jgi:pimeloyl-ACP methyl ester carboxylesterase
METSFLAINGDCIAVHTNKTKSDNSIIFIHGNSLNSSTFSNQFKHPELNKYQLIAIDFPGHGKSNKPSNPEKTYSVSGFINIIKEVINQLKLKEIILVGHSLGGHIAIEATDDLNNLKGLLFFGTPPIALPPNLEEMYLPHEALNYAFKGDLSDTEIQVLASSFSNAENNFDSIIKETDTDARTYIGAAIGSGNYKDEPTICNKLNIPIAIFHGSDDSLINLAYFKNLNIPTLWKNKVITIENCGHTPQIEKHNEFNSLLTEFAAFSFK